MHSLLIPHSSPELLCLIPLHRHDLVAELDPDNAGVLIVQLCERNSVSRSFSVSNLYAPILAVLVYLSFTWLYPRLYTRYFRLRRGDPDISSSIFYYYSMWV